MTAAKKPAKKPAKKVAKKAPKVATPKVEINLWRLSADLEDISIKVEQIRSVASLAAENTIFENDSSNIMWLVHDMLDDIVNRLDAKSTDVMEAHRKNLGISKEDWLHV